MRYWHTVRHLRPVQLYGRALFRLRTPAADLSPAPCLRPPTGTWCRPAGGRAAMVGPCTFRLLNVVAEIRSAADWNAVGRDKLWLYNSHYFDDLNARDGHTRSAWHHALLVRWIAENPPGSGNGWEPYPLSLRIANWVKWALAGNALGPAAVQSLAVQTRLLRDRLEWHLLGNHLFANAKALVFAGVYFEGTEADAWRHEGLEILAREIPEQVLGDGGHFELSPMYHAIIEADLLDLINLARAYPGVIAPSTVQRWIDTVGRMRRWLAALSHPDGEIAFFNDAAMGIAPPPAELEAYADRLQLPACARPNDGVTHLANSGYVRISRGDVLALLDVAPVGSDYLPGHAHADSLSFELSFRGRRVFVNSGTSRYGSDPERQRQRGTAAHNTVEVDGQDSSEVWGSFRVARRARPFGLEIVERREDISVGCAHDGYRRLAGGVTHSRQWVFRPHGLDIEDTLDGSFGDAVARIHLYPAVDASVEGDGGTIALPGQGQAAFRVRDGVPRLVASTFHPEFGIAQPNRCLEIAFSGPRCALAIDLRPHSA
jgi:uncharacterized heparinase superfamily protein